LRTRAIPERLRGVMTTKRYIQIQVYLSIYIFIDPMIYSRYSKCFVFSGITFPTFLFCFSQIVVLFSPQLHTERSFIVSLFSSFNVTSRSVRSTTSSFCRRPLICLCRLTEGGFDQSRAGRTHKIGIIRYRFESSYFSSLW